jgi:hypothetical protein
VPLSVQVPHPDGPFGAKGVGESGALSVHAAIANAIYNAVGVRITELPITPEKVLQGLRGELEQGAEPPEDQQPPATQNVGATDAP